MSLTRWRETGSELCCEGQRIFIHDAGSGDEALLLLHGAPATSWDFEAMWPGLSKRFARVVTLDFPGFGFSGRPDHYRGSVQEQANVVEALIGALAIRRVHLLAHGHGCRVAQELLARMQERGADAVLQLTSGVLLNAALFAEAYRPRRMQRWLLGPLAPLYLRLLGPRAFARTFSSLFGAQTQPGMIELHDYWMLIGRQRSKGAFATWVAEVRERRRQRVRWRQALSAAPVPLRLICGSDDPVAGRRMAERYRQLMANADVVLLDGIGHFPHVEAPDRTLRAVLAFHDTHFWNADAG